jgi:hypothetical protein
MYYISKYLVLVLVLPFKVDTSHAELSKITTLPPYPFVYFNIIYHFDTGERQGNKVCSGQKAEK